MTTPEDRDIPETEATFRAPEQLAIAMPLIAVSGLIAVVAGVALGASGAVVASLAVGGFGLCAVAPMALIEVFVARPLRGALAQLRAARDGRSARGAVFASGVLADLVHVARDLQAAQASVHLNAASPPEDIAAASEETARAWRRQSGAPAEAAAHGESGLSRDAQEYFADIVHAIRTMRDAPAVPGFDGAVERLESMLVYIAEAQERAEAKGRQFEGAFGRFEAGMADLARLVARETETVQGALSSNALLARNDIADALAQEKGGRGRLLERLDVMETRLTKTADGVAADVARLAEATRAEASRRAAGALAEDGRLDEIAAALARLEAGIAQALSKPAVPEALAGELNDLSAAVARLARDFAGREPGEAALRGVAEALAAQFREADLAGLRAQVREAAGALAAQVETLRVPDDDGTVAQRLEALGARMQEGLAALGREHAQTTRGAMREIAAAVKSPDALDRFGAELQAVARAVAALDGRLETQPPAAFARATADLGAVARRLEAALAPLSAQGEDARRLAETVEHALVEVAARTESAAQRHGEKLDGFAEATLLPARDALAGAARDFVAAAGALADVRARVEEAARGARSRLDALAESLPRAFAQTSEANFERLAARLDVAALTPARDALTQATRNFDAVQTRLTLAAAKIEAGDPRLAQIADAARTLRADFAALSQHLPDALAARVGAAGLDPARDALAEAVGAFDSARAWLDDRAEGLSRQRADVAASEARFAGALEDTVTRLGALGFERLPELVGDVAATQVQWRTRAGEFDRTAAVLAGLADVRVRDVAALRDAFEATERNVRTSVEGLAAQFESAGAAQGDRIVRALETRERESARELGAAIARVANLHAGLELALAQARAPDALEALRADLAASAQTVAGRLDDAVQKLARQIEDRWEALRRDDLAPAALALQASTQDLGKTHAELFGQIDAFKAALASVADFGARADASMRAAAERADSLGQNVSALVGAERAELAALAQALARIGERVEYAARAFEERRGGDVVTLGADLTREIDALARVTAERVLALEGGVETLAYAAGATLTQLREATRALSGVGLEEIASRLAPLAEVPALTRELRAILAQAPASDDWRPALDALNARLAQTLEAVERRLPALTKAAPVDAAASGAVVGLVVSMASALDARFSQIEATLAELSARLVGDDPETLDAGAASLARELNAASRVLKASLSDFAGVSAALAEEIRTAAAAPPPSTGLSHG